MTAANAMAALIPRRTAGSTGYTGIGASRSGFPSRPFHTRPRNLTPDNVTGLGRFTERQIFNALRYGLRPDDTPDVEITSTTPGQGNFPDTPRTWRRRCRGRRGAT